MKIVVAKKENVMHNAVTERLVQDKLRKVRIMKTNNIDFQKVSSIYYGADKACRCGCKGSYAEAGSKLFDSRMKKIMRLSSEADIVGVTFANFSLENNKAFTVYFK